MDVTINIDGAERRVRAEKRDGVLHVRVGERAYEVTDITASTGTLTFLADHRPVVAHVSCSPVGVGISIGGRNHRLFMQRMDADHPAATAGPAGDGNLEAPMPGAIVAVHVAVGDAVRAGDAVVVLESMKMQNEIVAPVDGVVRRVNCEEGQQVAFGELLVVIAAELPAEADDA